MVTTSEPSFLDRLDPASRTLPVNDGGADGPAPVSGVAGAGNGVIRGEPDAPAPAATTRSGRSARAAADGTALPDVAPDLDVDLNTDTDTDTDTDADADADAGADLDAGAGGPAADLPDVDADTAADADTDADTADWRQRPEVQTFLREQIQEYKRGYEQNLLDRVQKALQGDAEATKHLSGRERRLVRELRAAQGTDTFEPALSTDEERSFAIYARLEQEFQQDEWAFRDRLLQDDRAAENWGKWRGYLKSQGLPETTPVSAVRERLLAAKRVQAQQDLRRQLADADPDDVFDDLKADPGWSLLSEQERATLHPDNFEGSETRKVRLIERRYGELVAAAKRRQATKAARDDARGVNRSRDAARALSETSGPKAAPGTPARPLDYATLRRQYVTAYETGTLTPELERQWDAVQRQRRGPESFI